jgi:hypothetical protein
MVAVKTLIKGVLHQAFGEFECRNYPAGKKQ